MKEMSSNEKNAKDMSNRSSLVTPGGSASATQSPRSTAKGECHKLFRLRNKVISWKSSRRSQDKGVMLTDERIVLMTSVPGTILPWITLFWRTLSC